MSHFSSADWVDFARGLCAGENASAMRAHLDSKCEECVKSLAVWQTVLAHLSPEARYRPPRQTMKAVLKEYSAHKPWRWLLSASRMAELVFDSFRQPSPALVRGAASVSRRLVHQAEPFVIDLRLETVRDRLFLIGQILNSEDPEQRMHGVDVLLLEGEDLIASAKANSFGEFEVQSECDRDLRLFINIRGHRAIGIPVSRDDESTAPMGRGGCL